MRKFFNTLLLILSGFSLQAQIAINASGNDPDPNAMLDIDATDKGILIPRITADARDGISDPAKGLLVFVTDDNQFYYYDGTEWLPFGKNDGDWKVSGNDMYSIPTGNVGIGTQTPNEKFTVTGIGDIAGTTNADNGGIVIEDRAAEDDGDKLFIDANEIQTVRNGNISSLYINHIGGGVYFNQGKYAFDGDLDVHTGILRGGVGSNRETMLIYHSDPNQTAGNMVILSGSGLTVVSGGGGGHRALNEYVINSSDMDYNAESVYILADEGSTDDIAINMSVQLQSENWDDRVEAMNVYGNGMIVIPYKHDAGPNSDDNYADLILGNPDGEHLELDNNEIHAMNGANADELTLNYDGGSLTIFGGQSNGTININSGGNSFAINLPNDSDDAVGKGRANAWVELSDARLKSNITAINRPLEIISSLAPKKYFQHNSRLVKRKGEKSKIEGIEILEEGEYRYGFLAQEMYKILPEAVYKPENEETDYWSIHYTSLIPILTAAIQEQQKLIKELQSELQELKEKLNQ